MAALLSVASLVCRKALGKARPATPDRHEFSRSDILAWGLAAQHGAEQPAQVRKGFKSEFQSRAAAHAVHAVQTDLLLAAPIRGAACMLQSKPALRALAVYTC